MTVRTKKKQEWMTIQTFRRTWSQISCISPIISRTAIVLNAGMRRRSMSGSGTLVWSCIGSAQVTYVQSPSWVRLDEPDHRDIREVHDRFWQRVLQRTKHRPRGCVLLWVLRRPPSWIAVWSWGWTKSRNRFSMRTFSSETSFTSSWVLT